MTKLTKQDRAALKAAMKTIRPLCNRGSGLPTEEKSRLSTERWRMWKWLRAGVTH